MSQHDSLNLAQKLIANHLVQGRMDPGESVLLRFDQTLTQDATGTLVMLTLEAMGLDRAKPEVAVQYVDHNLLQEDNKNPDDHLFLASACRRFGIWFSPPGNGVSHPLHMQRFGKPGKALIGSDSHTCAGGALAMLAVGAGGTDVALALAGEPVPLEMPRIWGVRLSGTLPDWVSAKDVILEMLRRHGVDGAAGCMFEYYGPGLDALSAMDRHVIANMGQELGATGTVFPSDAETRRFLEAQNRGGDWQPLRADAGATFDRHEELDLSALEPLIAKPSSPGNVVPVSEVAGAEIYQAYIGSSANPGYRDFAIAAEMVRDGHIASHVSLDINPTSRQLLMQLMRDGRLGALIAAGARLHQAGCNGCIGMGQAPATGRISLRTVPRNFAGRSGTREDSVYLCSPETAAASALSGVITDPRTLEMAYPRMEPPAPLTASMLLVEPLPPEHARKVELVKGPNVKSLPALDAMPEDLEVRVLLKLDDDVSTDEILPAGARVLPFRSNVDKLAEFVFVDRAPGYVDRARSLDGPHAIVAGANYGQGSSREHAALAPRSLGLRVVIAKSIARIHWQNLVNFGVLPLTFEDAEDYGRIDADDMLRLENVRHALNAGHELRLTRAHGKSAITLHHSLSERQVAILLAGGLVNWLKTRPALRAS